MKTCLLFGDTKLPINQQQDESTSHYRTRKRRQSLSPRTRNSLPSWQMIMEEGSSTYWCQAQGRKTSLAAFAACGSVLACIHLYSIFRPESTLGKRVCIPLPRPLPVELDTGDEIHNLLRDISAQLDTINTQRDQLELVTIGREDYGSSARKTGNVLRIEAHEHRAHGATRGLECPCFESAQETWAAHLFRRG
jgi:hypothetical protein